MTSTPPSAKPDFSDVVRLIASARQGAVQAVNVALIDLYWQVGKTISDKLAKAEWGEGVVEQLALHIAGTYPGLRGFARPNLYRMRQFFEVYKDQPIVSTLLRQLSWSHNLAIMGQCKRADERQFYLEMSARENWPFRELERQIKGALFERSVLRPAKVAAVLRQLHPAAESIFKDTYLLEFLDLPADHDERGLHNGLLARLRDFLIELGRDFCFAGSQYPVQVGTRDFAIDLLFFTAGSTASSPSNSRWGGSSRNISAN